MDFEGHPRIDGIWIIKLGTGRPVQQTNMKNELVGKSECRKIFFLGTQRTNLSLKVREGWPHILTRSSVDHAR